MDPKASTCPWKFYLGRKEISESYSFPVIIGAVPGGKEKLRKFMVTAKQVEKDGSRGRILGHWEHQWDTIPICCYEPGLNYAHEGRQLNRRQTIPRSLNQSLMWTAPHHFVGSVVFVATFWKSSRLYWPHIESDPIVVTKEIHQPNFSQG
ncbi:putative defense protein Hdd11 [Orchesella cincta]|uniref:Putative defense protein Hdd11 n=1 Tax=Orchesella cincta TaxID=48709 RepID=A0A1D2MCV6_ORCCI|nr:putative defense protein Hdd11 [Orchesella cincta]